MGSGAIKRRKPRRRLPPGGGPEPGWTAEEPESQYTVDGYLRAVGRFARGASSATGWRRTLATGVTWLILAVLVGAFIAGLASLF